MLDGSLISLVTFSLTAFLFRNNRFLALLLLLEAQIQTTATFALANLEKSGKYWIKPENFEKIHFFPVSAPDNHAEIIPFY